MKPKLHHWIQVLFCLIIGLMVLLMLDTLKDLVPGLQGIVIIVPQVIIKYVMFFTMIAFAALLTLHIITNPSGQTKIPLLSPKKQDIQKDKVMFNVSGAVTDEEIEKIPITRDATWFLFCMLRQKGIIKQMTDTELSEIIGRLTIYSPEKLRQSKLRTNASKDKLSRLFEEMKSQIES